MGVHGVIRAAELELLASPTPETDEWEFSQLAPHLVLAMYLIRFHQGTPVLRGN